MKLEDAPRDRRRFEIIGAMMGVVMLVTAVGFFAIVILGADDNPPPAPATTTPLSELTPDPSAPTVGATVTRPIDVRSGPRSDYAIVTRLAITDAINVLGRSEDHRWVVVQPSARPALTGWVPADALTGVELELLLVIAGPGDAPPPGEATLSPDRPDLVISSVFSQQNVLWVEVLNQGVADAAGELRVVIDGEAEAVLDVKEGEALRPGQSVSGPVPEFYLQLRRQVEIVLQPVEGLEEEDLENNTWIGIVSPDAPNDIEILRADAEGDDAHLVVTLRNNSPIPIVGTFTVSVREALPQTSLLGRERATAEIPSGGTVSLAFPELTDVDLTRVRVIVSTDAIDDALLDNNSYPR